MDIKGSISHLFGRDQNPPQPVKPDRVQLERSFPLVDGRVTVDEPVPTTLDMLDRHKEAQGYVDYINDTLDQFRHTADCVQKRDDKPGDLNPAANKVSLTGQHLEHHKPGYRLVNGGTYDAVAELRPTPVQASSLAPTVLHMDVNSQLFGGGSSEKSWKFDHHSDGSEALTTLETAHGMHGEIATCGEKFIFDRGGKTLTYLLDAPPSMTPSMYQSHA